LSGSSESTKTNIKELRLFVLSVLWLIVMMHAPASKNNGLSWNAQEIASGCAKLQIFRSQYEATTKNKNTEKNFKFKSKKRVATEASGSTPKQAAIEHPNVH
jgi:hypothetical protein